MAGGKWFGAGIPGWTQKVCPAYSGTELPSQCLVAVTGCLLKYDFSYPWLPQMPVAASGDPACARGGLSTWLETPELLWGQGAGARVKDEEVAGAAPAPVMPCHGNFSEEIFHKAGPFP